MQITRKRDGELEDERGRGGGEEGEQRRCVCMCEPKREQRGRTRRLRYKETNKLCICGVRCHSLYTEAQNHSITGPCTDHNKEVHINYVMLISH